MNAVRLCALSACAGLALAPAALAQGTLHVEDLKVNPFTLGSASVELTCAEPDEGVSPADAACSVPVRLTARRTTRSWAPTGPTRSLTQQAVSLAAGERRTVTVRIPPAALRNWLATGTAQAEVTASTAAGGSWSSAFVSAEVKSSICGQPMAVAFRGAPVQQRLAFSGGTSVSGVSAGELGLGATTSNPGGAVTFTVHGVTYQVAKGSRFEMTCSGVGVIQRGRFFPTLVLHSGSVRVTGTPRGRHQLAATIFTPEGNLGSRNRERIDMTVTRRGTVSTMRVARGASTGITPLFHGAKTSPCTSGSALSINRAGQIRKA